MFALVLGLSWLSGALAQDLEAVVLASEYVPAGTILARGQVYVRRHDPAHIPANTFADVRAVVGRLVREPLLAHAPVREERLAPPNAAPGIAAILQPTENAVRVPLPAPSTWPGPTDRVDVLRVRNDAACYLLDGVRVLAGETEEGEKVFDPRPGRTFTALHLAVPQPEAGLLVSLDPREVVFALRSSGDVVPVDATLSRCDRPPEPEVAHEEDRLPRVGPGGARVVELLRGENAFIGELTLPAGGRVPPHRDPTEEYLVVLKGKGTVTIDGTAYPVSPGTLVYMPARAKVSYVNGARSLVALQVFAGPEPSAKYDEWRLTDRPPAPPARPRNPPAAPAQSSASAGEASSASDDVPAQEAAPE